ncbi:hypothetical protein ACIGDI_28065 [Streptomyces sp. NPDC085900]|uniref:hypothetical protein n=1 Tax=Streptomyces sp. NPDC085900 TaxID=3365737 RepID=UPI0037D60EE7
MSDQHAATALTAAVTATILIARAAILHRAPGETPPEPAGRRAIRTAPFGLPSPTVVGCAVGDALRAVHEAEHHVHRCWQQLRQGAQPP